MHNELDPSAPEATASEPRPAASEIPATGVESSPEAVHSAPAAPESSAWTAWVRQGFRAALLRPLGELPQGPSVWTMLLLVAPCLLLSLGLERTHVDGPAEFSLRSWLFGWAPTGIMIYGVWLLLNFRTELARHASPVAAWFLLSSIAAAPINVIATLMYAGIDEQDASSWWYTNPWLAWPAYLAVFIWLAAVAWRIAQAIHASRWVVAGLVAWTVTVMALNASMLRTVAWEPAYDESAAVSEYESRTLTLSQQVFETQQSILNSALASIQKPNGADRHFYGLVYAPYSEDVFLRESAMVQQVLESRFAAHGRVLRLVNHPSTKDTVPWATNINLERSLNALAKVMDTGRDVLVLYLTSHGGADFKLATFHYPLEEPELTAEQLKRMLDNAGIRNRVIAVSACYSGGWIEPLQNDDTLVMTAADKEHTSYGCGRKSELTYFGRALFDEQLRKTHSFEEAFNAAVPVIKQRETDAGKSDGFSNPQISVGANIKTVLGEWTAQRSGGVGAAGAP